MPALRRTDRSALGLEELQEIERQEPEVGLYWFSFVMILLWFVGDSGRLMYYVYGDLPTQFILGGITACIMDCVVLLQFFFYRDKSVEDVSAVSWSTFTSIKVAETWSGVCMIW